MWNYILLSHDFVHKLGTNRAKENAPVLVVVLLSSVA
jgi:hypothetical protein